MKEWQEITRPSCNTMHEVDMKNSLEKKIGTGGWRIAWKIMYTNVVLKTPRLKLRYVEIKHVLLQSFEQAYNNSYMMQLIRFSSDDKHKCNYF